MPFAARLGDLVLQDGPHCHAPIHPPAPVPTPVPHPPLPLTIIKGQPTVLIGNMPAARMTDMTGPCMLPGCIPAGPRSEEHTSELQSRFGISYAVFCLKK